MEIVYGLKLMCSHWVRASCNSCMDTWPQAGQRRREIIQKNWTMPVQLPCSFHRFCTVIVWCLYRLHTKAVLRRCSDCVRPLRLSQEPTITLRIFFLPKWTCLSAQPLHDARMMLLQHVYGLQLFQIWRPWIRIVRPLPVPAQRHHNKGATGRIHAT